MTLNVAVHGATGTQGAAIARRLRAVGHEVRPLNSTTVNLADVDSVVAAYAGVDAVVVQLPQLFDPIVATYAETILSALAKAGVARAVLNPGMPLPPGPVGMPFVDSRVKLAQQLRSAVGTAAVVGPAGPYLENLLAPNSVRRIRDKGELPFPVPSQVPLPWVALDDIGDGVAAALVDPAPATITALSVPQEVTGDRVAAAVGHAVGREVSWTHISFVEFREMLTPLLGAAGAAGIAAMYEQNATAPRAAPPAETVRYGATTVEEWAPRQDWPA